MNAARALVGRFLDADTSGDGGEASALVAPGPDSLPCNFAYDELEVVRSAKVGSAHLKNDTIVVGIRFDVLGGAASESPRLAGPKYFRFYPYPQTENVTVRVARSADGKMAIVCDPSVPPNHLGLAYFSRKLVPLLNDSSLARWRLVARGLP